MTTSTADLVERWEEPELTCPHIDAALASGELTDEVARELSVIRGINSQLRYGTWAYKAAIEAQQALIDKLAEALRPFAAAADHAERIAGPDGPVGQYVKLHHLLRARSALKEVTGE